MGFSLSIPHEQLEPSIFIGTKKKPKENKLVQSV